MKKKSNIKSKIRGAYITSLISISLVLLLLGIVGLLILNAQVLSNHVKENLCFSLLMKEEVKEPDIKQYQKTLDTYDFIKSTEYITKEEAAASLQEELGEDFLTTLEFNPLPATINVYLNADYANPDSIQMLETYFLTDTNLVSEVSYQHNLVHLINDNIKKISIILLLFSAALFLISFALLNNTIRLMIYSKRFIINTMKLVGAKKNFIRKPFILSGALQGFLSSIIAITILILIVYVMNDQIGEMLNIINIKTLAILFAGVIVSGVLLSVISTFFSINKYLRLKSTNLYY